MSWHVEVIQNYDNLSSSGISGFACVNAYRINHARLSEYILQKEHVWEYLNFAIVYI